ncbi:hypothetical protein AZE42_13002, partial [Rhizopogon vesiculosus]
MPWSLS